MTVATAQAERLAQLLRDAERAVVLTGAGISVPSGIPDGTETPAPVRTTARSASLSSCASRVACAETATVIDP